MRIDMENTELTFHNLLKGVFCLLVIYRCWKKRPSHDALLRASYSVWHNIAMD